VVSGVGIGDCRIIVWAPIFLVFIGLGAPCLDGFWPDIYVTVEVDWSGEEGCMSRVQQHWGDIHGIHLSSRSNELGIAGDGPTPWYTG